MLDAYAIKKIAPRILIGIILINLSIYIVTAASEATRLIANGVGSLITAPVASQNNFTPGDIADVSTGALPVSVSVLLIYKAVGVVKKRGDTGRPLGAFVSDFFKKDTSRGAGQLSRFGELAHWLIFVVIIPIALIFLGILLTLIFRQGLLILLAVTAPIAFAMYLLPSTEKYFKKWWELFIKTLMVYPIIVLIFAVADFLASLIFNANPDSLVGIIAGIITLFAPLVLIPFAFKFAGGAIATLSGALSTGGARLAKGGFLKGQQEYAKQRMSDKLLQSRYAAYNQLMRQGERGFYTRPDGTRVPISERQRRAARRAAGLMGGRNIEARIAEINKRQGETMFAQIATGPDDLVRAYTVNKERADAEMAAGRGEGDLWRTNSQGLRQYRTIGGAWVGESAVMESRRAFGVNNQSAMQAGLTYEMQKALTQEDQDRVLTSFGRLAHDAGLSSRQAGEIWIGSAFAKQNENRQWKHYRWSEDSSGNLIPTLSGLGLMQEIDERQGNWQMLQQNADTWTSMGQEVKNAKRITGDNDATTEDKEKAAETLHRAARIAFATRSGSYADTGMPGEGGEEGTEAAAAQAAGARARAAALAAAGEAGRMPQVVSRAAGAGAPGRVQEEINSFLQIADEYAGQYQPPKPPAGYAQPPAQLPPPSPEDSLGRRTGSEPDSRSTERPE